MEKTMATVMVDRPVEEVWRFVTDVEKMTKYDPDLLETRVTSPGPIGVGTTSMSKRSDGGTYTFRVLEFEPNRRFFIEFTSEKGRGAPLRGTKMGYVLEPMGGKTKLTPAWDVKLHGFYRLMGPMVSRSAKKTAETQVGNIKRMLESEAKS
jgi:uncharacterized protein YndB with AHSA1/START domain